VGKRVIRCKRWQEPERLVQIEKTVRSFNDLCIYRVRDVMTGALFEVSNNYLIDEPLNAMEVLAWASKT
jgi:hypothetical protein